MIYLICNCTNNKTIKPSENLIIANCKFENIDSGILQWKKYKNKKELKARELYQGHAWQETLKCKSVLNTKFPTNLLVASAGYGLISAEEKISSYQATFSRNSDNSIHKFKNNNLENPTVKWWNEINEFNLNSLNSKGFVFISVSYEYLIAMQRTIEELIIIFKNRLFIIVLSKKNIPTSYKENIIKFDTRFNTFQRGTINTIIQRFSNWLFGEIVNSNLQLNHQSIQNHINVFLSHYSEYVHPNSEKLNDSEISNFIKKQISKQNISSKTAGLKDLRLKGYSCSQERYGKIYSKIKAK